MLVSMNSLNYRFYGCSNFIKVDIRKFKIIKITDKKLKFDHHQTLIMIDGGIDDDYIDNYKEILYDLIISKSFVCFVIY